MERQEVTAVAVIGSLPKQLKDMLFVEQRGGNN